MIKCELRLRDNASRANEEHSLLLLCLLGNSELPSDIGMSLEVATVTWNHPQPEPNMPHVLGNSQLPSEW